MPKNTTIHLFDQDGALTVRTEEHFLWRNFLNLAAQGKRMCEKFQQTFDSLLKDIETLKATEAKETQELKDFKSKLEEAEKRLKETKVQIKETKAKIKTLMGKQMFSTASSRRQSKLKSTQSKAKKAAKSLAKCQGKEFGGEQVDNLLALIDAQKEPLAYLLSLAN